MASQKIPFKALALSRDLVVRLKNRGMTVTSEDVDTSGFPVVKLAGATGKAIWLHITTDFADSEAAGKVDALGLEQRVYTPHVVEILKEAQGAAGDTVLAAGYIDALAKLMAEVGKLGTAVKVYDNLGGADDSVATAATFAAAVAAATHLAADYRSDDIHPLTAQM